MRLFGGEKIRIDAAVQLQRPERKPAASIAGEIGWLGKLPQTQRVTEKIPRSLLAAERDRDLDVVEPHGHGLCLTLPSLHATRLEPSAPSLPDGRKGF